MRGILLDENLPQGLPFTPGVPVTNVRELGESLSDDEVWEHARRLDLVIVTKDADFSDRILLSDPPPRVVHLRFGNLRLRRFHEHFARVWPVVEESLRDAKLVNVHLDRIESVV